MRMKCLVAFVIWAVIFAGVVRGQESQRPLTLEQSIKIAMERSLILHSAVAGIEGSEFRRKEAITNFLPWWTGQYSWRLYNTPVTIGAVQTAAASGTGIPTSQNIYNLGTTVNQSLFTGGFNLATYRSARIGVDLSKETVETTKRDIVLQVRVGYFTILRAEKFLAVAEQQVKNFEAQLEVTQAFFDVGIVPKNDVLLAEVNLANAKQQQVKAANVLATAMVSFNILLR